MKHTHNLIAIAALLTSILALLGLYQVNGRQNALYIASSPWSINHAQGDGYAATSRYGSPLWIPAAALAPIPENERLGTTVQFAISGAESGWGGVRLLFSYPSPTPGKDGYVAYDYGCDYGFDYSYDYGFDYSYDYGFDYSYDYGPADLDGPPAEPKGGTTTVRE